MKQSKYSNWFIFLALLVFTLAFACLEWKEILAGVRGDPILELAYIIQPRSEWSQTSDWRGLLFIYEARCLWQLMGSSSIDSFLSNDFFPFLIHLGASKNIINSIFFSSKFSCKMIFLFYIMWSVVLILLYVMLLKLLLSLKNRPAIMFSFLFFLIISFIFIRHYSYAKFYKYLDGYFYHIVLSAIIAVRFCLKSKGLARFLWFSFILICLFHCIGFRQMSICAMPIFFYILTPVFCKAKHIFTRTIVALIAGGAFAAFSQCAINQLPAQHKHKAIVMMYSDMSIAGLLSGDWESFQASCKDGCISGNRNVNLPSEQVKLSQMYTGVELVPEDTDASWGRFCHTYYQYFCKYPKEMLLGRSISIVQFFSNFQTPQFFRNCITALCPKAHLKPELWDISTFHLHHNGGKYEKIYLYTLSLCGLLYLFINRKKIDKDLRYFTFISLVGFAYLSSFMLFVPTPDPRYHAFPVMAQCLFLSYLAAHKCIQAHKFIQTYLNNRKVANDDNTSQNQTSLFTSLKLTIARLGTPVAKFQNKVFSHTKNT